MIKKILLLKKFGIFQNFNWNTLPEFKEKNIFYGWNYSGKTTISRIFSSIRNKELDRSLGGAEFKIILNDGSEINQNNISTNTQNVLVFNSDYIRDNLKWDSSKEFNGITFDVGEGVGIREKIEKLEAQINKVNGTEDIKSKKEPYDELKSEFEAFEAYKFTNEAKEIKNDVFNSLIDFDKRHFKAILNQVVHNLDSFVVNDVEELNKIKKLSLASNDKEKIDAIEFSIELDLLYSKISNLLLQEPERKDILEILDKNQNVSKWVKSGVDLHKNETKCFFCENDLNKDRITQLNSYFSNASSILRNELSTQLIVIDSKIEELKSIKLPKSKFDFFENFQNEYQLQQDSFGSIINRINEFYNYLKSEVKKKEDVNIFVSSPVNEFDASIQSDLTNWINVTNNIIEKHNDLVENFNSKQEDARTILKKHQISDFLIDEDYLEKEKQKNFATTCIKKYDNYVKAVRNEIAKLESDLKSVVRGKDEINAFIQKFLNRSDIKIEVVDEDKFVLKRGDRIAENLSEGEKTAISFSYFLVSLESLFQEGKLFEYIIFIDDPISSLDANHIAQIYSLINSFFFRKNIDTNDLTKHVNCFKQLFLSTHNFEFFSFIKDSSRINKKNTKEYYFIKRISDSESTIQELPKALRDYKSEYIYLFNLIYNFHLGGCQESDEKFILMPNAVRRFLEIYTLFKLPDSTDEVDARLKILMPEPTELKLLHHFSHFTTFEKVMKHDEMILNLPQAIGELITLLEKDLLHFNSLKKAISA